MTDETTIRAWYVSTTRLPEIMDTSTLPPQMGVALARSSDGIKGFDGGLLANELGQHIIRLVRTNRIPSFHTLAIQNQLKPGLRFFYQGHFYGKGFGADSSSSLVSLSENVDAFIPNTRLVFEFSKSGLTTETARSILGGSINTFVFGSIVSIDATTIRAVPYIVGDLMERMETTDLFPLKDMLELRLVQIDQFSNVDFAWNPSKAEFNKMESISEDSVKELFCKLFSEVDKPKDWGGEESDLFTGNISLSGVRHTAALLLKGPSKFHEMKPTDCGKNGDQIYRLFNIPADIYIIQHCHKVSPAVRKTVEAFTLTQHSRRSRFAIIDGYNTCRILKANGLFV